jgi:predicted RNA-binding Zn-ribbon protein involved in translation (DUF1610 family)
MLKYNEFLQIMGVLNISLDKFGIQTSEKKKTSKKSTKKKTTSIEENKDDLAVSTPQSTPSKLPDFASKKKIMKCTTIKCEFKRTLFKKNLEEKDFICPKCGRKMILTE